MVLYEECAGWLCMREKDVLKGNLMQCIISTIVSSE